MSKFVQLKHLIVTDTYGSLCKCKYGLYQEYYRHMSYDLNHFYREVRAQSKYLNSLTTPIKLTLNLTTRITLSEIFDIALALNFRLTSFLIKCNLDLESKTELKDIEEFKVEDGVVSGGRRLGLRPEYMDQMVGSGSQATGGQASGIARFKLVKKENFRHDCNVVKQGCLLTYNFYLNNTDLQHQITIDSGINIVKLLKIRNICLSDTTSTSTPTPTPNGSNSVGGGASGRSGPAGHPSVSEAASNVGQAPGRRLDLVAEPPSIFNM